MSLRAIEEKVVVSLLALLIILVFLAASLRWFGIDVAWSVDSAQLLFAWICFIGADLAFRSNGHIGVDILVKKLPLSIQNIIHLFLNILIFCFLIMIFRFGTQLSIQNYKRTFNTLPISYSFATLSAPIGSLLMCLTTLGNIKADIKRFMRKDYSSLKVEEEPKGGQVL